jgi:phosphopantothenoylcysteine synthetase/decarboxylase
VYRALVVTGGTEVGIDDVRVISNKSTDAFGCAIANSFAGTGVETTLFGAQN